MQSALWQDSDEGFRVLTIQQYEYEDLIHEQQQVRFLVVHAHDGDKWALENHIKCHFEVQSLTREEPLPFIAVCNARGYRLLQEAIEVNGQAMLVPATLERLLRYIRGSAESIRLWIRHICLNINDEQERTRYWNREFVDSVYARASDVVDMSDTMTGLVEQGIIETVHDSRYSTWQKTWNELPTEITLPTVCPIRLGKKASYDNPVDVYEYVPLDVVANEIRILVLMESRDPSAPIVVHIAHCPIHCEVTYQALSYMWGPTEEQSEIVVNGQKMKVRKNLADALRAIRRPDNKVPVWADAICIDQENMPERNRQLVRMSEIYDNAAVVLCYVGEADEDSEEALRFVSYLQSPRMLLDEGNVWMCERNGERPIEGPDIPRLCGALYRFLSRPYFRRIWIVQEIAISTVVMVACSTTMDMLVDLFRLERAAYNLIDMLQRDKNLANQMIEATHGLSEVSVEALTYVRMLFYFRHLSMKGEGSLMMRPPAPIRDNAPGYLETAIFTRQFEATVALDKIYALWNLARDKGDMSLKMDYNKTIAQAFTEFAIAYSEHQGSLDVIGAAEQNTSSNEFYGNAPSWVPDWSTSSQVSCMVRRDMLPISPMFILGDMDGKLYSADGGMAQDAGSDRFFHFEGPVLHSTGVILDSIELVIKNKSETDEELSIRDQVWGWSAATADLFEHFEPNPYADPVQAAYAASFGDGIAAWPKREDNLENAEDSMPDEVYVCRPHKSRHIRQYARTYNRLDMVTTAKRVTRGRTMAVTKQGYIALTPKSAHGLSKGKTLWIAILATCSAPVLLVEEEGENAGKYRFYGTCFVQGWMDGEMVTEYMGVDSAEEFWQSLEGGEKLKIV